jgi:hypothetical protein
MGNRCNVHYPVPPMSPVISNFDKIRPVFDKVPVKNWNLLEAVMCENSVGGDEWLTDNNLINEIDIY